MTDIMPGDFLILPVKGAAGVGIQVGQWIYGGFRHWNKHDHAEVYIGQADRKGPYGYTASAYPDRRGIRPLPRPPEEMRKEGGVWSSGVIELTFEQRQGIVDWCLGHRDVGYSWLDYAALALHRARIPAPGLKEYIASTGHLICSAYTDAAFRLGGGVQLFNDGRWEGLVTPAELAALIRK